MRNKRKIAWLLIGGLALVGAIVGSVKNNSGENDGFWQEVINPSNGYSENIIEGSGSDKIAVIKVDGAIYDSTPESSSLIASQSVTADSINKQISMAESDPNVKAIVLQINSPGGTAVAGQTILERLDKFKKSGKKLYVAMREVAASAGYEIALPADKIYANPETQTGSIGVVLYLSNYQGLYDKIGVESVVIKSGEMKDIGNPDRAMTDAERSLLQTMVDESYGHFVSAVSKYRKLDETKVRELGDGRIFTGSQAKENGLIDEIGNFSAVIDNAKKDLNINDATVIEYSTASLKRIIGSVLGNISIFNSSSLLKQNDQNSKLMHIWAP